MYPGFTSAFPYAYLEYVEILICHDGGSLVYRRVHNRRLTGLPTELL